MQVIVILERKVFIKSCGKCLDWVPIEGGTLCKDESITCESMGGEGVVLEVGFKGNKTYNTVGWRNGAVHLLKPPTGLDGRRIWVGEHGLC